MKLQLEEEEQQEMGLPYELGEVMTLIFIVRFLSTTMGASITFIFNIAALSARGPYDKER